MAPILDDWTDYLHIYFHELSFCNPRCILALTNFTVIISAHLFSLNFSHSVLTNGYPPCGAFEKQIERLQNVQAR